MARPRWASPTPTGVIIAALLAVSIAVLWFGIASPVNRTGDTIAMIRGTHAALNCLAEGTLTNCGIQVAPYPLLQYLPSALFIGLGLDDAGVEHALGYLNAAAFIAMLFIGFFTLRRLARPALGAALLVALLASPLPWYTWTTFGEAFGALACLAFVAAALLRAQPWVLVLTLGVAGQSKETALPFLALMGAAALLWSPVEGRPLARRHWIAIAIGAVASIAITVSFNEFRFGQLTNAVYSQAYERTPTLGLKGRFILSLWAAPNAGLAVFWPVAVFAWVTMLGIAAARVRRWRAHIRPVAVGLVLLVCLAAMTYGYANWYAPFGWIAWGPRLMLLLTPALLIFGAATLAPELEALVVAGGRRAGALRWAAVALAGATVLAQIGVLFKTSAAANLFATDASCPAQVSVAQESGAYYHCIIHWAWGKHWVLPDAAGGVTASFSSIAMTLIWLAAAGVLVYASWVLVRGPRAAVR
jgi:hypothetical protein